MVYNCNLITFTVFQIYKITTIFFPTRWKILIYNAINMIYHFFFNNKVVEDYSENKKNALFYIYH